MKAIWKDTVIAESDNIKVVENNPYFPMEDVHQEYLKSSDHHTRCPWKGKASYFHIEVEGDRMENAAWIYPEASQAAKPIEDHVAFKKGVEITE